MTRIMAAKHAHDRTANYYRGSWGKWCEFVGISRDTGDNMVRVAEQFGNIQIDGQNLIDLQPMKLLYIASKSTTPPEIRKRVETLNITTCKQYQEALSEIRARDAKIHELLEMSEAADRRADDAQMRAREAQRERDGARQALAGAKQRGDRWREEAEKTKAELDALRAQPIQVTATLCAAEDSEQDHRDAYDAFVLAARNLETIWRLLRPQVKRLDPEQAAGAKNLVLQKLMEIKEELIHECKDRQP